MTLRGLALSTSLAALAGSACGPASLDAAALSNAEYQLPSRSGQTVRVRDGKWAEPPAEGRQTVTIVDMNARGDLNGDGVSDAVVLLVYSGGGSGTFVYLAAVLNDQGRPRHVSSVELGDRVKVNSIVVADMRVTVGLTIHGRNDAACCPTEPGTRVFGMTDQKLVEIGGG